VREFALHSGWNLVREYVDHESGKVSDREQFQRMFEDASRRHLTFCSSGVSTGSAGKAFCPR
jgi:DNA invertase Pin-like site-specific DNA recombinase